ncbi:uncharacterized protein LOC120213409 [Hibiscus syriacus]|uniref:uncharacterized protein LOC120213409 n=1 Tax=Hibiscus syriacus TaxID=106335 RepID=UPI0019226EEC|nr:uncharacterized protein LOC120213409 [Hibiscus syriacus]
MNGFSTVDGFVEITESLAEMIKYIANEPSLGLLYVQKHTQDAVPNVIDLSNRVAEKSWEASLHSEDSEDSITMVRTMKECGFPIVDEMIKDIANSLMLISSDEKLKQGLVHSLDSGFTITRTRSWGPISWSYGSVDVQQQDGSNYFSTLFKSAREKASSFKWLQFESKEPSATEPQKSVRCPAPSVPPASASIGSIPDEITREKASDFNWPELESKRTIESEPHKPIRCPAPPVPSASASIGSIPDEITREKASNIKWPELESKGPIETEVRCLLADKLHEEVKGGTEDDAKLSGDSLLFVSENYDEFKADKESKLEQWLEGSECKLGKSNGESETDGV